MSEIKFGTEAFDKIKSGIDKTVNAVKSTYGPNGNTVFIKDKNRLINTKDGVTVARHIQLEDPFENIGSMLVKEVAEKSNQVVGDGTTSSSILIQSLVNKIAENKDKDINILLKDLVSINENIVRYLEENKIEITNKNIEDVAYIASNGDKHISGLLKSVFDINENGEIEIIIKESENDYTNIKYSKGYTIKRGYHSPMFINNHSKEECHLINPDVIIYKKEINNFRDIEHILEEYATGRPLVFMCNYMSPNVILDITENNRKGILQCLVMQTPINNNHDDMQDIISVINGEEEDGYIKGSIEAVHSRCSATTFINNKINNKDRIESLKNRLNSNDEISNYDKENITSRIKLLNGGVATIHVGAISNVERKEKIDRVEDAVKACQSALKYGVVQGAGVALYLATTEDSIKDNIFSECFKSPLHNLSNEYNNIFKDKDKIEYFKKNKMSINLRLDKYESIGKAIEIGVIDPFQAIVNSVNNSISVAKSILTNKFIINND